MEVYVYKQTRHLIMWLQSAIHLNATAPMFHVLEAVFHRNKVKVFILSTILVVDFVVILQATF